MTSNINPNYPAEGSPTTESVRQNFYYAKTEIEALQAGGGESPQISNTVLAGPTSGSPAIPDYRLLVEADMPIGLVNQISSINAAHTSLTSQVATLSATVSANYLYFYNADNTLDSRVATVSAAVSVNTASIVSVNDVVSALDARVAIVSAQAAQTSVSVYTVNQLTVVSGAALTSVNASHLYVNGTVCATAYYGDGSNLTNLPEAPTSVSAYTVNDLSVTRIAVIAGKLTGVSATFSGIVSASEFTADIGTFVTKVSTGALAISGVVSGSSAVFSAEVCAGTFYGSGAGLTNLPPGSTSVTSFTTNQLTVVSGAAFGGKVSGTDGQFSGVVSALEVDSPTGSFSTLVSAAALTVSGIVSGSSGVFSGTVSVNEIDAPTGSFSTKVSAAALVISGITSANSGVFSGALSAASIDAPTGSFSTNIATPRVSAIGATATLTFATSGVDRIVITSAGNVGIATAAPGSTLDVKGTLRLSGASSGYVGLAPAAAAGSTTYTLPSADGSSGQVLQTNGSGTLSWATAGGSTTNPTITVYTTGSGTYTTPANVKWIFVRCVGGGGGGGGSGGGSPGAATAGGNTTFGTSLLTANGGALGGINTAAGGAGGSASGGDINVTGGRGRSGGSVGGGTNNAAGHGGGSPYGQSGPGGYYGTTGFAGTGYGGGGGGGGPSATQAGASGGGGGGYTEKLIASPNSTYSYAVGAAGSAGTAGDEGYAGGAGTAGVIIIEEHYNY